MEVMTWHTDSDGTVFASGHDVCPKCQRMSRRWEITNPCEGGGDFEALCLNPECDYAEQGGTEL